MLLPALDQAYGSRPEAHAWIALPETFRARLELMSRVDIATPCSSARVGLSCNCAVGSPPGARTGDLGDVELKGLRHDAVAQRPPAAERAHTGLDQLLGGPRPLGGHIGLDPDELSLAQVQVLQARQVQVQGGPMTASWPPD